jgi:hypothetical protein
MSSGRQLRRLTAGLLLTAVVAAAGGLHNHQSLSSLVSPATPGSPEQVVSNHSPLSGASHWHSIVRSDDHPCLACHAHRFAAVMRGAHGPAAVALGLFVSHAAPLRAAFLSRLGDPTRGPPSLS